MYIPSQEELNFAKENINHKVAQSSFQGQMFEDEEEEEPPSPQVFIVFIFFITWVVRKYRIIILRKSHL